MGYYLLVVPPSKTCIASCSIEFFSIWNKIWMHYYRPHWLFQYLCFNNFTVFSILHQTHSFFIWNITKDRFLFQVLEEVIRLMGRWWRGRVRKLKFFSNFSAWSFYRRLHIPINFNQNIRGGGSFQTPFVKLPTTFIISRNRL